MLEQSFALQREESCTFAPKIYTSKHPSGAADTRPVHVRLTEKAKQYQDSHEKRVQQFTMFDDDGNRLFVPKINTSQKTSHSGGGGGGDLNESSEMSVKSNIGADEFLYQDAKDREIRHQNRITQYEQKIAKDSQSAKINKNSEKMLRRRMVFINLSFACACEANFSFLSFLFFVRKNIPVKYLTRWMPISMVRLIIMTS
jgi:hypothetical protein